MRLHRQRGVAVVTALLLTTLAISIVASLFWQQQVQVRSMENQRLHLQTKWILRGALDWSSVVLRQSNYSGDYTSLDQVWATPLAETRLDQYIERERVEGENFDASLSGNIIDATSRYNLANLAKDGIVAPRQRVIFGRLLDNLRLEARFAQRIADFVAAGQPVPTIPTGGEEQTPQMGQRPANISGTPMPLLRVDDLLAVQGITPEILERLRPFVIVLPTTQLTAVNVNTAPAEVLAAVLPGYTVSEANVLVEQRKRAAWRDLGQFKTEIKNTEGLVEGSIGVSSNWFVVQSRIRLDRAALNADSLIQRDGTIGGGVKVIWTRQN
ncbi:type II secretion system minor pseudopilin GspK [Massilia niastensis]|uniref:type II secretion system minor pseudopilin GspK n=1 Tax=Massilia niastensis TaxID=544911 RepID=UPI00037C7972|nr:type II secretion system minor pseudopilin GspK [Massilia niastensis]